MSTINSPNVPAAKPGLVIFAASLGTVFEWYDFFLYGTLAVFFGPKFFPSGNETASVLANLAVFGVGFCIRPLGAVLFGHLGDLWGRKHTFLVTIVIMGVSTTLIGLAPTYAQIGVWAPILLVGLRMAQGLALGGESGGASTYVAEHAPSGRRGLYTSWINTTATVGLILALLMVFVCRSFLTDSDFRAFGWRIPFLGSVALLAVSVWIRLSLQESPLFAAMKTAGLGSNNPVGDAFGRWSNLQHMLLVVPGLVMGCSVVWYTGEFQSLFFLQNALRMEPGAAYLLMILVLSLATPFFVVFGWMSDKVGRKRIMLCGCLWRRRPLSSCFTAFPRRSIRPWSAPRRSLR